MRLEEKVVLFGETWDNDIMATVKKRFISLLLKDTTLTL